MGNKQEWGKQKKSEGDMKLVHRNDGWLRKGSDGSRKQFTTW